MVLVHYPPLDAKRTNPLMSTMLSHVNGMVALFRVVVGVPETVRTVRKASHRSETTPKCRRWTHLVLPHE